MALKAITSFNWYSTTITATMSLIKNFIKFVGRKYYRKSTIPKSLARSMHSREKRMKSW